MTSHKHANSSIHTSTQTHSYTPHHYPNPLSAGLARRSSADEGDDYDDDCGSPDGYFRGESRNSGGTLDGGSTGSCRESSSEDEMLREPWDREDDDGDQDENDEDGSDNENQDVDGDDPNENNDNSDHGVPGGGGEGDYDIESGNYRATAKSASSPQPQSQSPSQPQSQKRAQSPNNYSNNTNTLKAPARARKRHPHRAYIVISERSFVDSLQQACPKERILRVWRHLKRVLGAFPLILRVFFLLLFAFCAIESRCIVSVPRLTFRVLCSVFRVLRFVFGFLDVSLVALLRIPCTRTDPRTQRKSTKHKIISREHTFSLTTQAHSHVLARPHILLHTGTRTL